MKKFDKLQVKGAYDDILRARFGALYDWEKPEIKQTVGPYAPEIFDVFEAKLDNVLSECFDVLQSATVTELEAILSKNPREETGVRSAWRAVRSDDISNLKKSVPHWAAGGFGHPYYVADFEYWARMPNLFLHEAVSLSLGVEPRYLEKRLDDIDEILALIAPPLVLLKRRDELFKRQFSIYSSNNKIDSTALLAWIKAVDLDVHRDALKALERFHGTPSSDSSSKKRPDKRELDSVATLFTAMAIEQFGYDPNAKRSPTPKEVQDLAASLGISMSDDTIRHYLRHGAKFIDPDWKPHSR